jgi:anti-sigma factor RsiW
VSRHRHGTDEMRCGEMVEYLSDYLDGDLDAALRRTIDEHGGQCPPCRAFIRTLQATVEAVRSLPRRRLGRGAVRSLVLALRKASVSRL